MTETAQPTPEQRKAGVAGVFDRAAATYDQVGVDFFGRIGEILVRRTAPQAGERVLDVGCGKGASALPAARLVGPTGSVLATDLAPAMVDALRRRAGDLPWLTAQLGDAEQPPAGPFDVVQASLVLFFLPDVAGAVDRYRVALAPGGRLGFTWFGEPDHRWDAVQQALASLVPAEQRPPARPGAQGPFASLALMHDFLAEHGWGEVTTETHRLEQRVRDADHWFEWSWSQGYRFLLEMIEARGQMARARELVDPLLAELADDDGIPWRAEVHCTLARP